MVSSRLSIAMVDGLFVECEWGEVWVSYRHNQSDRTVAIHVNDLFPALPKGKDAEVMILSGQFAGCVGRVSKWGRKKRVATVVVDETSIELDFAALIKVTPGTD